MKRNLGGGEGSNELGTKTNSIGDSLWGYDDRDFKFPVLFFRWRLELCGFVLGIRRKRNQGGGEG